jgi:sugar O-acyltransferase (sialic acid O-acetyltransferase NeuD family)
MTDPHPISLIGAGEHATVVADVIALDPGWRLCGCWAPEPPENLPWLGDDDALARLLGSPGPVPSLHLALVGKPGGGLRRKLLERLEALGPTLSWAALRHPSAVISASARVEPGSFLGAGAIVNPRAVIHRHALVNTGAIVEHDVVVGEGAHLAPGTVIGGGAVIGAWAQLGLGSAIRDHVKIGTGAVVGMGAVVVRDVPDGAWVLGNPARLMNR